MDRRLTSLVCLFLFVSNQPWQGMTYIIIDLQKGQPEGEAWKILLPQFKIFFYSCKNNEKEKEKNPRPTMNIYAQFCCIREGS